MLPKKGLWKIKHGHWKDQSHSPAINKPSPLPQNILNSKAIVRVNGSKTLDKTLNDIFCNGILKKCRANVCCIKIPLQM